MKNVKVNKVIHSTNPDIDTLICPKCKTMWMAQGDYDYDSGGWYYINDEGYCINNCVNFFGFRIMGKEIKRVERKLKRIK